MPKIQLPLPKGQFCLSHKGTIHTQLHQELMHAVLYGGEGLHTCGRKPRRRLARAAQKFGFTCYGMHGGEAVVLPTGEFKIKLGALCVPPDGHGPLISIGVDNSIRCCPHGGVQCMAHSHDEPSLTRRDPPAPVALVHAAQVPTKKGRRAATADDFEDIVAVLAEEADPRFKAAGMTEKPMLSFDNASIHKAIVDRGLLPPGVEHVPLPSRSPDLHKVIEHTFGRLKPRVHEAVFDACRAAGKAELSHLEVRTLVERTLKEVAAAEKIAGDCESLTTTLRIVGTDRDVAFVHDGREFVGTGGDWAPRGWR